MSTLVLTATAPPRVSPAPLEQAVLVTLAYSDLFEYPLTPEELRHYLPVACGDADFDDAMAELGPRLSRRDGFVFLRGRDELVELRRRRCALAESRWRSAHRFASWLAWVPFLRMVAVCGSQAVENGDVDGDVDLFLVTEPERLWLVQSISMVLRRLGRWGFGRWRLGVEICPNYLVTRDRLEIDERNLYVAREIAQVVPLWGEEDYDRFLDANRWIRRFLPQLDLADRRRELRPRARPWATRAVESLLGGRLGRLADRAIHRLLLVYYRIRLRGRGWRRDEIEHAYRPDRQALITGGYAGAVAREFLAHARRTLAASGDGATAEDLRRFFYGDDEESRLEADPHFAGIFARRYAKAGRS